MLAVFFALCASLFWGAGDLLAGLSSRQASAWAVSLGVQASGLLAGLVVLVAWGRSWIGWAALAPSLAAGLLLSLGTVAFFRAMAIGPMSVVAPIAGSCAVVPVVVGLVRGDDPSALQAVGAVAAMVGVMLSSRERAHPDAVVGTIELGVATCPEVVEQPAGSAGCGLEEVVRRDQRAPLGHGIGPEPGRSGLAYILAVLASLSFGLVLVGFAETAKHDPLWPAIGARFVAVPVLGAIVVWRALRSGRRQAPSTRDARGGSRPVAPSGARAWERQRYVVPAVLTAGMCYLTAATLYSVATTRGLLSLVAVLSSFAAVLTVTFAHVVLHERLGSLQRIGVTLAVLGVLAIAGG